MPDEPDGIDEAIIRTEDAFGGQLGRPNYEEGLHPDEHDADEPLRFTLGDTPATI